ncbi:unnamed protein product [Triticum turgidum subsp. durum]|uniref:PGG domain-containing protein n=1 Tax=Triticum turgidum subsp. durum TaxID=4567 RepID=A0A9R0YXL2_TRITD|nr:unnamed protein product [Triticum turgidum subsp. durum]
MCIRQGEEPMAKHLCSFLVHACVCVCVIESLPCVCVLERWREKPQESSVSCETQLKREEERRCEEERPQHTRPAWNRPAERGRAAAMGVKRATRSCTTNRRPRYLAFFYSNSTSFMASIVIIIMLLPQWLPKKEKGEWEKWSLRVMNRTIILDLIALLVAYTAGSNRGWKTSVYAIVLIVAVLGYFVIHMTLSRKPNQSDSSSSV